MKKRKYFVQLRRNMLAAWERFVFLRYKTFRRKRSFIHSTQIIPIKKGSIRYHLVIIETSFGKLIWNVGRHDVNDLKYQYTDTN
jgi:hypothetical protein